MENHFSFEDLKVYQKAVDFVDQVYIVTKTYPESEKFNLISQFQRAAVSITLNIAEGNGASNKENLKYLRIASRTLKECVVCLTISRRREYIEEKQHSALRGELVEIGKMLSGLIRYMNQKK